MAKCANKECGHDESDHERSEMKSGIVVWPCFRMWRSRAGEHMTVCGCGNFVREVNSNPELWK
jgi:hypothetical protein